MFPNFRVFDNSENVLLAQLQMINSKEDQQPAPAVRASSGPMADLADKIEAELKAGRATTCSEALANIAKTSPHVIDRAHDFKQAVEGAVTRTAEQKYFAAIAEAERSRRLTREDAQSFVNRTQPALREQFVAEHNSRHAGSMVGKPIPASRAYWNKVQETAQAKGLSQAEAMRYVNTHFADLREAMVKEVNG